MNKKHFSNKAKPIALIISTVFLASNAFSAHPLFAKVPAAMQTKIQNNTLPNLFLSIDNSGSMSVSSGISGVTRMESVRAAVLELFELKADDGSYLFRDKFRWGLSVFNSQRGFTQPSPIIAWFIPERSATTGAISYRQLGNAGSQEGTILVPLRDPTDAHVNTIEDWVRKLKPDGGTPLMSSVYRAYHHYSTNPEAIQYRCQKNNLIIIGDGEASYNTSSIALAATNDLWMEGERGKSSTDKEGSGFDSKPFAIQTVQTSTIGYGHTDIKALQDIAKAGKGIYVRVNSTRELAEGLKKILDNVEPFEGYSTVSTLSMGDNSNVKEIDKTVGLSINAEGWVSKVEVRPFLTNAQGNKYVDLTKAPLPARYGDLETSRRVVISTPKGLRFFDDVATKSGITFSNAFFDINSTKTDAWKKWVKWTAAHHNQEDSASDGLRDRGPISPTNTSNRNVGDVLDSPILLLGDKYTYHKVNLPRYMVFGSNDGMVKIYSAYNSATPYKYKFGYIPGTAPREGDRTFMKDLKIRAQADYGSYQNLHEYFVNGGIAARQTENDHLFVVGTLGQGGKAAYALNVAGKDHKSGEVTGIGSLAGNLANGHLKPDKWLESVPLWDTSSNQFGKAYNTDLKLGYTISTPIIARVALARDAGGMPKLNNDVRYAAFLANGYQGSAPSPSLYVLDALGVDVGLVVNISGQITGQRNFNTPEGKGGLIQAITAPSSADNGLSSPAIVDIDFDNIADLVYAGDRSGNLYRFDLRGKTPSSWTSTMIYKGDSSQPITSSPAVFLNGGNEITVVFGTGSNIYNTDFDDSSLQTLYGIKDDITFLNPTARNVTAYSDRDQKDGLLKQELTDLGLSLDGFQLRGATRNKPKDLRKFKGWYIDMKVASNPGYGERIVHAPVMLGSTVFFTSLSLKPMQDIGKNVKCGASTGGAFGAVMSLDAATGAMPSHAQANYHKTKKLPDNVKEVSGWMTSSPTSALNILNEGTGEQDGNGLVRRVAKSSPLIFVNNSLNPGVGTGQWIGDEWVNLVSEIRRDPKRPIKECKNALSSSTSATQGGGGDSIDCGTAANNNIRTLSWREIF